MWSYELFWHALESVSLISSILDGLGFHQEPQWGGPPPSFRSSELLLVVMQTAGRIQLV